MNSEFNNNPVNQPDHAEAAPVVAELQQSAFASNEPKVLQQDSIDCTDSNVHLISGQTKKGNGKKFALILGSAIAFVLLVSAFLVLLFTVILKSPEDYMLHGDYQKAYDSASNEDARESIIVENAVAVVSYDLSDGLKDPSSFVLKEAWYGDIVTYKRYRCIVLYVNAKNSYGARGSSYYLYWKASPDEDYSYVMSSSDLSEEKTYSYQDSEEKKNIETRNWALNTFMLPVVRNSSNKVDKDSVKRINTLFENELLEDVVYIDAD